MTPKTLSSFSEACDYLFRLERIEEKGIDSLDMKLEKMVALLDGLGNPQNDYRTVHVAGTNGKGSTCSFLSAILSQHGYKTGLHTSPHLFSFNERMKVNGKSADKTWIVDASNRMRHLIRKLRPSFFEVSTAMSFLYFSEMEVDIAVVEVGLGGRLDATNVILPELSIITQIDIDHVGKLGNTKEEIAVEKGGIIKNGRPVLLGDRDPKIRSIIREIARGRDASYLELEDLVQIRNLGDTPRLTLLTTGDDWEDVKVGLNGVHQNYNAALALGAANLLHGKLDHAHVRDALENVIRISSIRGRCEILSRRPFVVADVAHNPQGFESGINWFLNRAPEEGKKYIVFGVSEDKDYKSMLECLKNRDLTVIPVKSSLKRGLDIDVMIDSLISLNIKFVDLRQNVADSVKEILKHSSARDSLYLGGSHYTVGEVPDLFF